MPTNSPKLPEALPSTVKNYAVVVLSVVLTTLLRFSLNPLLGRKAAFIVYFPALVFSAWVGGWGGGVLALTLLMAISDDWQSSKAYLTFTE